MSDFQLLLPGSPSHTKPLTLQAPFPLVQRPSHLLLDHIKLEEEEDDYVDVIPPPIPQDDDYVDIIPENEVSTLTTRHPTYSKQMFMNPTRPWAADLDSNNDYIRIESVQKSPRPSVIRVRSKEELTSVSKDKENTPRKATVGRLKSNLNISQGPPMTPLKVNNSLGVAFTPATIAKSTTKTREREDKTELLLHNAAGYGNSERLYNVFKKNEEALNQGDPDGRTPAMYSVKHGRLDNLKFLYEQGADLDLQDEEGATAFHHAVFDGNVSIISFLIEKGANHLVLDQDGRLPLHWAAHTLNMQAFDIILKMYAPKHIDAQDASGMTALMWCAFFGRPDNLQRLLQYKANTKMTDIEKKTVVHWAVGHKKCLQLVAEYDRTFDADMYGKTPMLSAAERGSVKAVKVLYKVRRESVDDMDMNMRTALHWAAVYGHEDVVKYLVSHGAVISHKDSVGKTPIEYAQAKNFHHVTMLLMNEIPSVGCLQGPLQVSNKTSKDRSNSDPETERTRKLHIGCYLGKFTENGKGLLHQRYFWVDAGTKQLCWLPHPWDFPKGDTSRVSTARVLAVDRHPSPVVLGRKDYDAKGRHQYAFTLTTSTKPLLLVAPDEEVFNLWVEGLKLFMSPRPVIALPTPHESDEEEEEEGAGKPDASFYHERSMFRHLQENKHLNVSHTGSSKSLEWDGSLYSTIH